MYLHGTLHRDISIGNVLAAKEKGKTESQKKRFEIDEDIKEEIRSMDKMVQEMQEKFNFTVREKLSDKEMIKLLRAQKRNPEKSKNSGSGDEDVELKEDDVAKEIKVVKEMKSLLETVMKEIGEVHCAGFITDYDMSKNWKELFENWDKDKAKGEKSVSEAWLS